MTHYTRFPVAAPGGGVIWSAVIPAKAGIHSTNLRKCAVEGLDSRFRGNDWRFERDPIPNDTTAQDRCSLTSRVVVYARLNGPSTAR